MGHLLTRSGLTYPEVSSKVYHDTFCQFGNSVSLRWVIYYEAFYLHVVSSFSYIPVICPKLVLFLIPISPNWSGYHIIYNILVFRKFLILKWQLSLTFLFWVFNLLKPTGHVMHHQFNIQQLYAPPTLYLCILYLSENKQRLVPLTS